MLSHRARHGFTLTEILVVLAVVLVLTALLLPAFTKVRQRSYQLTCVSNLKQLGMAVALYQQDYDGLFPRGGDPTDIQTDAWKTMAHGEFAHEAGQLLPLTYVMRSYTKSNELWHCPADNGFDKTDMSHRVLDARPSSFERFGMSYYYHTKLTFKRKQELKAWDHQNPPQEHGASDIHVFADGHGSWHGGKDWPERRYNVLMGDGHVSYLTRAQFVQAWRLDLDGPNLEGPNEE